MFSTVAVYRNQHYDVLKRECQESRMLFEDPEFPCINSSLFYRNPLPGRVEWKRPGEISENPHLFVEGISSHDLNQGEVGNCWFVAACSCLALKPYLWQKVIPNWKEQEWDPKYPEKYAGIFHFQFWIFGEWTDVVVDDRLPTISGNLIYCHSKSHNEFWSALLEKAYAKLSGCYESLSGGNTGDAVVDFSGAVNEPINLESGNYRTNPKARDKLFSDLLTVFDQGGIISCAITASPHERELRLPNGLVKGHAYSVTAVKRVRLGHGLLAFFKNDTIPLIRMRNPWGKHEWDGPWSDSSQEWEKVGIRERANMGITVEDDGEFWMSFDDWCQNFTDADVCRLMNTSLLSIQKVWHEVVLFGSWAKHTEPLRNRCGGCMNHRSTFLQNPQYMLDISKDEEQVLVSLQQRDMKIHRAHGAGQSLTVGFAIFKVELNRKYRIHDIITQQNVATSTYINARSVFMRKTLPEGRYVIIPSTFKPDIPGDFMLRVFTKQDTGCRELHLDKPRVKCWSSFMGYPQMVTHIYVHGAEGLENQDRTGGADPYVVISCENSSVQSRVQRDTRDPVFDARAIFYRKNPHKPITIQVWNSNTVKDQFMGQVVVQASLKDSQDPQTLQLKRGREMTSASMPGLISLRVVSSTELTAM
ncbi:calpain-5-like [Electrophorus electricus]|uniref:calpain-5-like n=1 Tax=Electrophorus electricus TaxID=8005 RepID=UPI000F0A354E|nr:calpain-5-like [Electrophorus electricus]XP_026881029.1 calpain-5-like [Electrophorus electricus]XP_026881030.1 calpain-5-like [Electrophorus electricus]